MTLPKDFLECTALFVAHEVRFMVVGGHAVMAHGYPRFTDDFDLWVEPTRANARRVLAAFEAFGFGGLGLDTDTFAHPDVVVQIGRPPLRIDVLTSPSGVAFGPCYEARMVVEVDGLELDVIGLECLKANKAAAGRPQDLADLSRLP